MDCGVDEVIYSVLGDRLAVEDEDLAFEARIILQSAFAGAVSLINGSGSIQDEHLESKGYSWHDVR